MFEALYVNESIITPTAFNNYDSIFLLSFAFLDVFWKSESNWSVKPFFLQFFIVILSIFTTLSENIYCSWDSTSFWPLPLTTHYNKEYKLVNNLLQIYIAHFPSISLKFIFPSLSSSNSIDNFLPIATGFNCFLNY